MKHIPHALNHRLLLIIMLLLVVALIGVSFSTRPAHASDPITMDATAPVLSPGDVLTLRGNQRFNHGQSSNLSFFIGPVQVAPDVIDASTVQLTVPDVEPGTHTVRVVKHAEPPDNERVEFSQDIEIGGERVLASVSGDISPGGGRLELPDVARVELVEDEQRPTTTVTIEHVLAPGETKFFRDYLASENIPQVTVDTLVRVLSTERINDYAGVRVKVPAAILAALTPATEPELYAEIPSLTADVQDMGEFRALHAEYNAETGELSAPFAGNYFNDPEEAAAAQGFSAQQAQQPQFTGRIRVSVRNFGQRQVPVEATTSFPAGPTFDASPRETLNLSSHLKITTPISLTNPTIHGGARTPIVRGAFAANHGGIDLRSRDNDPISAAADGTVGAIFNNVLPGHPRCNPNVQRGGGWSITINHADGTRTSYSHLIVGSELVVANQQVTAGQQIALADHTGGTCPSGPGGAHLHLGYRINGVTVNPLPFIQADPVVFKQQWLDQLSVIAVVDGTPVSETRQQVTVDEFDYNAPLDLSKLNLQPNRTYPVSLRLMTQDGQFVDFYSGRMRIKPTALRVVLTWDKTDTDVDLHVRDSNGNHAWYADLDGIPGAFLDHDDVDGFGPEVFTMETLAPNTTYTVFLHYYSDHGNGPTTARTVVYLDNVEVTNATSTLVDEQMFTVGTYPPPPPPPGNGPTVQSSGGQGQPFHVTFQPTSDPNVLEYTLPSLPNVRFVLVRKPQP